MFKTMSALHNNSSSSSASYTDETEDFVEDEPPQRLDILLDQHMSHKYYTLCRACEYMATNVLTNCVTCPLYGEMILTLIQLGSTVDIPEEYQRKLGYRHRDKEQFFSMVKTLLSSLKDEPRYVTQMMNTIYVSSDYQIRQSFRTTAKPFNTSVEHMDFTDIPDNHKLRKCVPSRAFYGSFSRVVVLSEFCFKAQWEADFVPIHQVKGFYRLDKEVVAVPFMVSRWEYSYHHDKKDEVRLIELKLKGRDASMVMVLPTSVEKLPNVERNIAKYFFLGNMQTTLLDLEIPTFRAATVFNYGDFCRSINFQEYFTEGKIDLIQMARNRENPKENDLYVNEFFQRVDFECNENGLEIGPFVDTPRECNRTHDYLQTVPLHICATYPFIFYIKIKGLILFIGKVTDPTNHYPDRGGPIRRNP